jgi:hypothetical protein
MTFEPQIGEFKQILLRGYGAATVQPIWLDGQTNQLSLGAGYVSSSPQRPGRL